MRICILMSLRDLLYVLYRYADDEDQKKLSPYDLLKLSLLLLLFRDNLVLLQVGFKSLSYELQEEQPAYDRNSLFGKMIRLLILLRNIIIIY